MIDREDQFNKNQDDDSTNGEFYGNNENSEYGLPEAEYNPIEQEQPESDTHYHREEPVNIDIQPQKQNSSWPVWVAILVILLLAGGVAYFYLFNDGIDEDAKLAEQKKVIEKPVEPSNKPEPVTTWEEEKPAVEPKPEGSVSTISSRTGRYYLIVGSFVDADLAQDYAKRLAKEGNQAMIIEPFGNKKFYRLSVKDAESFDDLNAELDQYKTQYGENVWIVKY